MTLVDDQLEDLADMTLIDENIARGTTDPWVDTITGGTVWWPNFLPMHVAPPGGQISFQYKSRHLVGEFQPNACGTICLLNLLAIRCIQLWCQPMGPLCLWQCFRRFMSNKIYIHIWKKFGILCKMRNK